MIEKKGEKNKGYRLALKKLQILCIWLACFYSLRGLCLCLFLSKPACPALFTYAVSFALGFCYERRMRLPDLCLAEFQETPSTP